VRVELAQLLARTDRASDGVTLLEDGVKRAPESVPAREALLRAYLAIDNLKGASGVAEELKRRQPQSAIGFYYAGLIASREKRLEESQAEFESALKLQPHRLDVLTSLVQVQMSRGAHDAAIGRVQAALGQEPNNVGLLNLLGELY